MRNELTPCNLDDPTWGEAARGLLILPGLLAFGALFAWASLVARAAIGVRP